MDQSENNCIRKKSSLRRNLIEWSVMGLLIVGLYATGYHTHVMGFVQRGLLATGLMTPGLETDPAEWRDAGEGFYFADDDGVTQSLRQYRGKVIFLNIWASWCPPCIAEMPSIQALYTDMQSNEDVVFLFISVDEDFDDALKFVRSRDLDLPIYHYRGKDRDVFDSDVVPTTYVITPSGKIAMEKKGMAKYDTEKFKSFLKELK